MLRPLALALILAAPAAAQDRASRLYHLDWGPLSLADIRISREAIPDGVRLVMDARTLGVATLFSDVLMRQTTTRIQDGPRTFRVSGMMDGEDGVREVRWPSPGARPVVTEPGPPPDGPLTPLPEGALASAVDPGSAALLTLAQAEAGRGCGGTWRLFDGVRLMEMTVIDEGEERLVADRDWTYSGPALRCRIRLKRLGGFPADEPRETEEREYDRRLWLAPVEGDMAPVRLEIDWPLGAATARVDLR